MIPVIGKSTSHSNRSSGSCLAIELKMFVACSSDLVSVYIVYFHLVYCIDYCIIMILSSRVILSVYHILVCLIIIAVFAVFLRFLSSG